MYTSMCTYVPGTPGMWVIMSCVIIYYYRTRYNVHQLFSSTTKTLKTFLHQYSSIFNTANFFFFFVFFFLSSLFPSGTEAGRLIFRSNVRNVRKYG